MDQEILLNQIATTNRSCQQSAKEPCSNTALT